MLLKMWNSVTFYHYIAHQITSDALQINIFMLNTLVNCNCYESRHFAYAVIESQETCVAVIKLMACAVDVIVSK